MGSHTSSGRPGVGPPAVNDGGQHIEQVEQLERALRFMRETHYATLEELETLGQLGIPFGQGWLFGKPTPLRAG